MSGSRVFTLDTVRILQLIEWGPNFKVLKEKFTYTEIWSLSITPNGENVITARDNECVITDVCEYLANYNCQLHFCDTVNTFFGNLKQ